MNSFDLQKSGDDTGFNFKIYIPNLKYRFPD